MVARIEQRSAQLVIVADNDQERALIRHGQQQAGWLVLLDASYPVGDEVVGLPRSASLAVAARVRAAFEEAARAHAVAEQRRSQFRLIDR